MNENYYCDPLNAKSGGIVDIWQESLPVRFGSIDKSDRMTLDAVFNYFQEAAISHADNLGVGRDEMTSTGQVWILSRMTAVIDRRPNYLEKITVQSWPRGWEKLFALRNYQIRDKDDVPIISARSAWLIVDIEKRRPLRPQALMNRMPQNEGLDALPPEAGGAAGLEERSGLIKISERKAVYTDLDFNGHVNNVRYIHWIEDALDIQLLEKFGKMRIDINYLNEVRGGETVEIFSAPIEDADAAHAFALEGRKKDSGQAAFRAELRLQA